MDRPFRIAILGAGRRSSAIYAPIIAAMPDVDLVAVWSRSADSAARFGRDANVPHYTDLQKLIDDTAPDAAVVSVAYSANGKVGLTAVRHGLSVLLETPIAHDLGEADEIVAAAAESGAKIEVAEQFHRRPSEALKLKMLAAGIFGRVYSSFSDFAGHGYHGVSVMRSYLGFDARPVRVSGVVRRFGLATSHSRLAGNTAERDETQEHAIVEFDDGRIGLYHWTSVGYDSPLRWWRSSRFLAERGLGIVTGGPSDLHDELSVLSADGHAPQTIPIERRFERTDGGALVALVAHLPAGSQADAIEWRNPFAFERSGYSPQWHDDEIAVASCLKSLIDSVRGGGEPTYGARQALLDQEIVLAMQQSSRTGAAVSLPLDREAKIGPDS